MQTAQPTEDPTRQPSAEPTEWTAASTSTVPTFTSTQPECDYDYTAHFSVIFDFSLNDTRTDAAQITQTLQSAVGVFVTSELAALADCPLDSYALNIRLTEPIELYAASANASLCFSCAEDETLSIDVVPEELERDFINVVDDEALGVLTVDDVTAITIRIVIIIVEPTAEAKEEEEDEPPVTLSTNDLLMIMALIIALLVCCLIVACCAMGMCCCCRSRKQSKTNVQMTAQGIRMQSTSAVPASPSAVSPSASPSVGSSVVFAYEGGETRKESALPAPQHRVDTSEIMYDNFDHVPTRGQSRR